MHKSMARHLLWVEPVGLKDSACRAFKHPQHQERFNEGIGVALRSALRTGAFSTSVLSRRGKTKVPHH